MKNKLISLQHFKEIIDYAGYTARDYSGRGMYGRKCLALSSETNDLPEIISDLAKAFSDLNFDPDGSTVDMQNYNDMYFEMCEIIRNTSTDQLGLGIIVYWPTMKVEE